MTNISFQFHLRNIALLSFEEDEAYRDIVSPFSRVYLINEGNGFLKIGNSTITLETGYIYLIPSFVSCSYFFQKGLSHYYVHFGIDHPNGLSPYIGNSVVQKVKASELDRILFRRLLHINPNMELPHHDPKIYHKKPGLNKMAAFNSTCRQLETTGILSQVFSRYPELVENSNLNNLMRYNMDKILLHIQTKIHRNIKVKDLADIACFSEDHFSRIFKSMIGLPPGEYILQKRLEKVKYLLHSTSLPQKEIADKTGFNSVSYLSRIFKKNTGYSPHQYRQKKG